MAAIISIRLLVVRCAPASQFHRGTTIDDDGRPSARAGVAQARTVGIDINHGCASARAMSDRESAANLIHLDLASW